jgi:hypothetical protein
LFGDNSTAGRFAFDIATKRRQSQFYTSAIDLSQDRAGLH